MNNNSTTGVHLSLPGLGNKEKPGHLKEHRIPGLGFLPNKTRNHFIASVDIWQEHACANR